MSSTLAPLAERLRPESLDQLVGQKHLTGQGSILRTALEQGKMPSMILWGPPGTGKTTIANIIAHTLHSPFYTLSAISSGVKEVREVIEEARKKEKVILFIDEIHRFNKGQQDALLGAVERGIVTLIGATTENPSFELNGALLSRCRVWVLEPLAVTELRAVIDRATTDRDRGLGAMQLDVPNDARDALARLADGDARRALSVLEAAAQHVGVRGRIDVAVVTDTLARRVP